MRINNDDIQMMKMVAAPVCKYEAMGTRDCKSANASMPQTAKNSPLCRAVEQAKLCRHHLFVHW